MTDNNAATGRQSWWKQVARRRRHRLRPTLTALEGRTLLSVFMVENTLDDGSTGSLRGAIVAANAFPGADLIEFSPTVFSTPQTINLTLGELRLTDPAGITIQGTAANLVTIDGNHLSRVFEVVSGVTADISGLTITGGTDVPGSGGGGLLNNGTATLTDCTVTRNIVGFGGGGLFNSGTLTLSGCTVSDNNTGTTGGGGLFNRGTATLTDCTISGNTSGQGGGGILNAQGGGPLALTGCTISGNFGSGGGGLYNNSTATLTDCTFSGNTGGSAGGGIENLSTLGMTGCTVSANSASFGSGLFNTGTATLTDTIVAHQTAGGDILDPVNAVTGTYNLIGDGSGQTGLVNGVTGNQVGTTSSPINPLLAPLGDYGGPTLTMALLPGSPAIDAGTATGAPAVDQRGFARIGAVDIGAFERQGAALVVNTAADGIGSGPGQLSLRQAVNLANTQITADTITFDPAVFGSSQTINLDGTELLLSDPATTTITGPGANLLSDQRRQRQPGLRGGERGPRRRSRA